MIFKNFYYEVLPIACAEGPLHKTGIISIIKILVKNIMPARLSMPIGVLNGSGPSAYIQQRNLAARVPLTSALNTPMIGRIFNTPAGCSSCGKR